MADKRALLLDAAEWVFCRVGYAHTTIAAIAAEAGVTRPTVYAYFESKDEVFHFLADRDRPVYPDRAAGRVRAPPRGADRARPPGAQRPRGPAGVLAEVIMGTVSWFADLVTDTPSCQQELARDLVALYLRLTGLDAQE